MTNLAVKQPIQSILKDWSAHSFNRYTVAVNIAGHAAPITVKMAAELRSCGRKIVILIGNSDFACIKKDVIQCARNESIL